ncbi:helix-turn-helix domain-containing protein [Aeromicrobium marinum]|uniref:helix-turn-helix domain-containing protein n=1 Tax=Aeromicrobium marinum TaxID=219314 RepID=UPI0001BCD6EC|nr:cupin domain-containing protein [Aeromicrobium marinum]
MTDHQPSTAERIAIGHRIRSAREAAGISVRELSRRLEVSPSHVSQVERGLASFSVRALYRVVSELEISMDSLFGEVLPVPEVPAASDSPGPGPGAGSDGGLDHLVAGGVVLRQRDRPTLPLAGGTRWERLTPRPENGAEFIQVVYPPAVVGDERQIDFIQHSSREYGLILTGRLTVQVGFDTTVLEAGDSIAFDSGVPHRFWNETPHEVRAVWFILDSPRSGDDAEDDASARLAATGKHGGA